MACSCSSAWNDSFSKTVNNSEFVALVKVISFDEYLDSDFMDFEEKMPYSMTVEIIKKYKGKESRKRIKIWGDNGILCRPYLTDFEINGYYLIAPNPLDDSTAPEYDFFSCSTDYLKVNMFTNMAYGKYSMVRYLIDLKTFERKLDYGDWDLVIAGSFICLLFFVLAIVRRRKLKKIEVKNKL
ncbi:hypothetical protein UMM65_01225 [Aureibaculum sp. 2210JD6-5]|uniref:hypothetical protein n=1 Tax=Aureibaculum sp. 2210JD6-5 TaxID=3103957 RepID=UPI002AACCFF1|nr:hypothetical protein [Aureibaculum sp. 2210JD6-5]MDY7393852.1 hypothetical protein [Aureibaculum sp. 2210JD6-5]